MLLKQNQKVVKSILFIGLLTLLASCSKGSAIESLVQADPKLVKSQSQNSEVNPKPSPSSATTNNASSSNLPETETTESVDASEEVAVENNATKPKAKANTTQDLLPTGFPASFPIYPQAELGEVKLGTDDTSGMISWNSSDNRAAIADYYQAELIANGWKIIKPFSLNPEQIVTRAIAIKDEQRVALTLLQSEENGTKLSAVYQPLSAEVANSGISTAIDATTNSKTKAPAQTKAKSPNEANRQPDVENNNSISTADFTDLDNVPEQLNEPLKTVASLGILTPYTGEGNVEVNKFAPNAVITKGEYARWLIAANNRYYQDDPGKKIYTVTDTEQPAFQDVKPNHPDFAAIQSLAEAGLIPSRLTDNSTNLLFRPDAPLTREDLITWKVPLDLRQALPQATIEAIKESWGFQDTANIDSSAIRALYADFQNGDRSNIRRVFGFTTLFQPNKPVTRAEAATSLWYFGFQGDGITAQEVLETETETDTES